MRFGRSAHNFEGEIVPLVPDENGNLRELKGAPRMLNFHVVRPEGHSNMRGVCHDVKETRAGGLIIFGEGGKRFHLANGTWSECITETKR